MGVMENSDLLRELRIDRGETEPASRRPLWIALGAVALAIVGAIAWFAFSGSSAPAVHTAVAKSMASSAGGNIHRATERQTVVSPMIMASSAELQP